MERKCLILKKKEKSNKVKDPSPITGMGLSRRPEDKLFDSKLTEKFLKVFGQLGKWSCIKILYTCDAKSNNHPPWPRFHFPSPPTPAIRNLCLLKTERTFLFLPMNHGKEHVTRMRCYYFLTCSPKHRSPPPFLSPYNSVTQHLPL